MTFKDLVRSVELYLHIEGAENNEMIKTFINESTLDFIRKAEWEKLKKVITVSLDDSGQYDLSDTNINPYHFQGELALTDENGRDYYKVDYKTYLRASDKTYYWSITGTDLFITGDALDIMMTILTPGLVYPLVKDADSNLVSQFYPDIIKKMSVIKVYDYIGEDESVKKEELNLARMLDDLKKHENRIRQSGKLPYVNRK